MRLLYIRILVLCLTWIGATAVCQTQHMAVAPESTLLKKTLSYACAEQPIGQILKQLSDSFDLKFTYINNDIPVAELRSVNCGSCPLEEILDQLFPKGNIAYIPILSQILLKAQKRSLADTLSKSVKPQAVVKQAVALVDSVEVIVIKRGVVSKRRKQAKYVYLNGTLELDHFGSFYDYETVYGFVYDTLASSADTTDRAQKIYTVREAPSSRFRRKRYPNTLDERNSVSVAVGLGSSFRSLGGSDTETGGFDIFGRPGRSFDIRERRDSIERAQSTYFASLSYQHKLSRYFFAKLGIAFVNFREQGSDHASFSRPDPDPQKPSMAIKDTTISYENEYSYVGLPIGVGFTYGRRLGFSISPAVMFNLLMNKSTSYPQEGYEIRNQKREPVYYYKYYLDASKKRYSSLQVAFQLDVELFYRLSNRFRAFVAPSFCYSFSSIYKSSEALTHRPYLYGVKLGLSVSLDRP